MNRRKLFSGLGLGAIAALFGAGKAKAETLPAANQDGIWVTDICTEKVDAQGKLIKKPYESDFFIRRVDITDVSRDIISFNEKEATEYKDKIAEWNNLRACGTVYKRVYGTFVVCPKCGGASRAMTQREIGILVE